MRRSYNALIIILAAISIILSMLDINGIISIVQKPYVYVDASIWLVFVFDYFYGLMVAKDKRFYFRTHIWDLLAIIPLNALFSFFRFNRIFKLVSMQRILLVFRFARLAGIIGKLQLKLKTFLKTNNIVYLFYVCGLMLLVSARFAGKCILVGTCNRFDRRLRRHFATHLHGSPCRCPADDLGSRFYRDADEHFDQILYRRA